MTLKKDERLCLVGYYLQSNLGDDIFKSYLQRLLDIRDEDVFSIYGLQNTDKKYDKVILGGGDLLTKFALEGVQKYITRIGTLPIVPIGVGCPYAEDAFDWSPLLHHHIILRHKMPPRVVHRDDPDQRIIYFNCYSSVIPDLVFLALPVPMYKWPSLTTKIIGVCPARPKVNDSDYNLVVGILASFLDHLVTNEGYKVKFLAFGRHTGKSWENDIVMSHEIVTHMKAKDGVIDYTTIHDATSMDVEFSTLHAGVCMRFHSHVFATRHGVPFLSFHPTPKVKYLLSDLKMEGHLVKSSDDPIKKWGRLMKGASGVSQRLRDYTLHAVSRKQSIERMITSIL